MDADMMLNEKLKKIDDVITKKKMIMDGHPVIPFTSAEKMIAYEYPAIWFTYMSKFDILIFFPTWRDKSIFLNVILVAENWHVLNTSDRCVYTLCTRKRRDSCSLVYEKYTNCLSERIQERVRFLPYIINNSVSFFASA